MTDEGKKIEEAGAPAEVESFALISNGKAEYAVNDKDTSGLTQHKLSGDSTGVFPNLKELMLLSNTCTEHGWEQDSNIVDSLYNSHTKEVVQRVYTGKDILPFDLQNPRDYSDWINQRMVAEDKLSNFEDIPTTEASHVKSASNLTQKGEQMNSTKYSCDLWSSTRSDASLDNLLNDTRKMSKKSLLLNSAFENEDVLLETKYKEKDNGMIDAIDPSFLTLFPKETSSKRRRFSSDMPKIFSDFGRSDNVRENHYSGYLSCAMLNDDSSRVLADLTNTKNNETYAHMREFSGNTLKSKDQNRSAIHLVRGFDKTRIRSRKDMITLAQGLGEKDDQRRETSDTNKDSVLCRHSLTGKRQNERISRKSRYIQNLSKSTATRIDETVTYIHYKLRNYEGMTVPVRIEGILLSQRRFPFAPYEDDNIPDIT